MFRLKNNLKIFLILIIGLSFVFITKIFFDFNQYATAVNGNYNRDINPPVSDSSDITMEDWNYLDDDFLLRDGSNAMDENLDMGVSRVLNLNTNSDNLDDLANIDFVDERIGDASGGDFYVNWGRGVCEGGDTLMYFGYGFSTSFLDTSGSSNPICISDPLDNEFIHSGDRADALMPLGTGADHRVPNVSIDSDSTISYFKILKCAVCMRANSACYDRIGDWGCASGFDNIYEGYILGGPEDPYHQSTFRECVNRNFDESVSVPVGLRGSVWFGSRIEDDYSLSGFNTGSFIKCTKCCN